MTMFLAAAASLYVVAEKIPAISFLTPIDKLIIMTLSIIFSIQLEDFYLVNLCNKGQGNFANYVDNLFSMGLLLAYVVGNIIIFGFYLMQSRKAGDNPMMEIDKGVKFLKWKNVVDIEASNTSVNISKVDSAPIDMPTKTTNNNKEMSSSSSSSPSATLIQRNAQMSDSKVNLNKDIPMGMAI
jgi:hypothetical protein